MASDVEELGSFISTCSACICCNCVCLMLDCLNMRVVLALDSSRPQPAPASAHKLLAAICRCKHALQQSCSRPFSTTIGIHC